MALLGLYDEVPSESGEFSSNPQHSSPQEPLPSRPAKSHYVETVVVELRSPTLRSIWRSPGREKAILDLYQLQKQRGPLIEEIPEDPGSLLITFLYLGDDDTRAVSLTGGPLLMSSPLWRYGRTDVWFLTLPAPRDGTFAYNFSEECYEVRGGDEVVVQVFDLLDELNPDHTNQGTSRLLMPLAKTQAEFTEARASVGQVFENSIDSMTLGRRKRYDLYVPANLPPRGVAIFFDGESFANGWPEQEIGPFMPAPQVLDGLIERGLLPPLLAVFVHAGSTRDQDLLFNPAFADFLADELLPGVASSGSWAFGPERVVLVGASFGGLCASYVALQRSDSFGAVLSMSGSFWVNGKDVEHDPLTFKEGGMQAAFLGEERLPIKFYLETGCYEIAEIVLTNRHLRDILISKGYDVIYREHPGNHDFTHWTIATVNGLLALTGDW